jgi:hypothetical protein
MRFLRPAASFAMAVAFHVAATGLAHADESPPPSPANADTTFPKTGSAPEFSPAPTPTVFVHLNARAGVRLEVDSATMSMWTTSRWKTDEAWSWFLACEAPCDKLLPLGHEYRLVGPGIVPSRPFSLDASAGQSVAISARTASVTRYRGGIVLVALGSVAIAGGLFVTLLGLFAASCDAEQCGPPWGLVAGGLIVLGGVAVVAGGIVLALTNEQSDQTQRIVFPKPPPRPDTAWLRAPVWRDSVKDSATGAARVAIPIFSRSF